MESVKNIWNRLFLIERASISLSLFRIAIALTTIFYVAPTLCHMEDNYFSHAFRTVDPSFFPLGLIELVQKSPQWVVYLFVWIFAVSSFSFLIGFLSQISCIVMVASAYYFHTLNSFHLGSTLSWDILLVALFLMCLTAYHGDYFSIDCLLKGREEAYKRRRPFFIQRLLQLHVGFMYLYTSLYKFTAEGNWLSDNPLYYVLNYPPAGVTKAFLLRDFMMDKPELCYILGVMIVVIEFLMLPLLVWRKTRVSAIYLGSLFQFTLLLTLDVPAILFLLFVPLLFLWIDPEHVIAWIEQKRTFNRSAGQLPLIFDGQCGFCRKSLRIIKIMDLYDIVKPIDFRTCDDLSRFHRDLTPELASQRVYFIEPNGVLFGGFHAFRRLCFYLPMAYPLLLIMYFPGMGILGPLVYTWIARSRKLLNKYLPNALN